MKGRRRWVLYPNWIMRGAKLLRMTTCNRAVGEGERTEEESERLWGLEKGRIGVRCRGKIDGRIRDLKTVILTRFRGRWKGSKPSISSLYIYNPPCHSSPLPYLIANPYLLPSFQSIPSYPKNRCEGRRRQIDIWSSCGKGWARVLDLVDFEMDLRLKRGEGQGGPPRAAFGGVERRNRLSLPPQQLSLLTLVLNPQTNPSPPPP